MSDNEAFNDVLERSRVGIPQLYAVGLILLALMIDGMDIQLLALVAPVIIEEWNATRTAFGPALSAAVVGMAIGSVLGGWLGDRFGRRRVLLISVAFFGILTLLVSQAHDIAQLMTLRLLSGVGFGAALPNGLALASEWMPKAQRTRALSVLSIGVPIGGMLGAPLALALIPTFGWRGAFAASGIFTIIVAFVMLKGVPESPGYLFGRKRFDIAARTITRTLGVTFTAPGVEEAHQPRTGHSAFRGLLSPGNMRMNLGVWLASFCIAGFTYGVAAWGPVVYSANGLTLQQAINASFWHNAAAVVAALSTSFVLNRFGSKWPMVLALIIASATMLGIGALLTTGLTKNAAEACLFVLLLMTAAGYMAGFTTTAVYTLLSISYAQEYRTTAIGTGIMVGRVGAILMITLGGALLDIRPDGLGLFATLAALLLLAAVGALILDRHVAPRNTANRHQVGAGTLGAVER